MKQVFVLLAKDNDVGLNDDHYREWSYPVMICETLDEINTYLKNNPLKLWEPYIKPYVLGSPFEDIME